MKKFEIGMVIQAIDKVTGPARGISASIRKMAAQSEEAAGKSSRRTATHMRKNVRERGRGMSDMVGGIGKIGSIIPEIAAVTIGVATLTEGYKKITEASDEAESAQLKLSNAMLHVKGATKGDVDGIADLALNLQKTAVYDDELLKTSAARLATFGMTGKIIKGMLPAFTDYLALSAGTNATAEDGVGAAKLLGKAWAGNSTALKRQGIVLTAAQEMIIKHGTAQQRAAVLIKAIEGRAGGLAAKLAKTPEGMKKLWNNQLNEIEEKAGAALTPLRTGAIKFAYMALPYMSKFADMLPTLFTQGSSIVQTVAKRWGGFFNEGFSGANVSGLTNSFQSLGTTLQRVLAPAIPLFQSITKWLYKAVGQIAKWLVDMWVKSQPGLKALAEAFSPIIAALSNLWHSVLKPLWDSVLAPFLGWLLGSLVPFLVNILGPAFRILGGIIGWVINLLTNTISGLFTWLGNIWPVVSKFFTNLWARIKVAFGVLKSVLGQVWQDIWNGLFKWVSDKWGAFLDIFKKVGSYLGFGGGSSGPPSTMQGSTFAQTDLAPFPVMGGSVQPTGANGTINGQIHVSHDPGLRVRTRGDFLGQPDVRRGLSGVLQ